MEKSCGAVALLIDEGKDDVSKLTGSDLNQHTLDGVRVTVLSAVPVPEGLRRKKVTAADDFQNRRTGCRGGPAN
jgi:hypothetical protein